MGSVENIDSEKPIEEQCKEIATKIMQIVIAKNIYHRDDIKAWQDTMDQDVQQKNLVGLKGTLEYMENAFRRLKEEKEKYYARIDQAVRDGIFTPAEGEFSKKSYDARTKEKRDELKDSLSGHLVTSERLMKRFETELIRDMLSDAEWRAFKDRFIHASYEEREDIIKDVTQVMRERKLHMEQWEVSAELVVGRDDDPLTASWISQNLSRLSSMKGVSAYKTIYDKIQRIAKAQEKQSKGNGSRYFGSNTNDLHSGVRSALTATGALTDGPNGNNNSDSNQKKAEIVSHAVVAITRSSSNVVTNQAFETLDSDSGGVATPDAQTKEQMEEDTFTRFQERLNRAFKSQPEVSPTGLQMIGASRENAAQFIEILTTVRERNIREEQTVEQALQNSSVNLAIFKVLSPQEEYELAA